VSDFEHIPGRVLLDTNVVNFTLDHAEAIFDGAYIADDLPAADKQDIAAFRHIFLTGQRAQWQIAVSPHTYDEISATRNSARMAELGGWFGELWVYWREFFEQDELCDAHADALARRLEAYLTALPQVPDRVLIAHAIAYGCDAFCTRDRKTILNRRHKLRGLKLKILSPAEWWHEIEPWGAIWA
jgi:predicted nucleic acid-binding protein